ncbi:MAG TPA: hypothetical protein VK534_02570 [Methylomirabilota bacterium]|nr:hypothetical protein [Methylomirabilota bacterium]
MLETLEKLRIIESDYKPEKRVIDALEQKQIALVALTGPFGVGKSSCIREVVQNDDRFGRVKSFTTRERREGEWPHQYNFQPSSPKNLDKLLDQARHGHLLQYAVAPFNGHVYGSYLRDYNKPMMLLDALTAAIPRFKELPFKRHVNLALAAHPNDWQLTSRSRFQQLGPTELKGRIQEGISSLEWSLEHGDEMQWVQVEPGGVNNLANEVIGLAEGSQDPQPFSRVAGELLLNHLKTY